jgi:gluconolactonase
MFDPPQTIATELFCRVPDALRRTGPRPAWFDSRPFASTHSFLEGPAFDRDGNLYCVDMPYGRIFRIAPDGTFAVVAEYDGNPNGLRIHKDGRIFIADRKRGLMVMAAAGGEPSCLADGADRERFLGLNDLNFGPNGDLYFTDQGDNGLENPNGAIYCLRAGGRLDKILGNLPGPNGLALNADGSMLYLNVSRANAVWSMALPKSGAAKRVSMFLQLSGSTGGPDGLALLADGGLAVAHSGLGVVWIFSKVGEPLYRVRSCADLRTTNIAFGGADRRTLYITESHSGSILRAQLPVAGQPLFSHA